jgi:hypothetical protein
MSKDGIARSARAQAYTSGIEARPDHQGRDVPLQLAKAAVLEPDATPGYYRVAQLGEGGNIIAVYDFVPTWPPDADLSDGDKVYLLFGLPDDSHPTIFVGGGNATACATCLEETGIVRP